MNSVESGLAAKRKRTVPIGRKYDDVIFDVMETRHTGRASSEMVAASRRLALHLEAGKDTSA